MTFHGLFGLTACFFSTYSRVFFWCFFSCFFASAPIKSYKKSNLWVSSFYFLDFSRAFSSAFSRTFSHAFSGAFSGALSRAFSGAFPRDFSGVFFWFARAFSRAFFGGVARAVVVRVFSGVFLCGLLFLVWVAKVFLMG